MSQDPDHYKGRHVEITATVFNVLGRRDGAYHFQVFTDANASKGNTHLVFRDDPRLKVGYEVKLTGTVQGALTTSTASGQELKLPELTIDSYQIVGPPTVVAGFTPTITPTAENTITPTDTPSPEPTQTATASAATETPTPESAPTETPTEAASPTSPPAATGTATPAPTPVPATATPAPASTETPEGPVQIRVEAESGSVVAPMTVGKDAGASGGEYLYTTRNDQGWNGKGTAPSQTGSVTLTVDVPRDGTSVVWTRLYYENVDGNSYWLLVDNGPAVKVGNEDQGYRRWKWVDWADGNTGAAIKLKLSAGSHTVVLIGREAKTRIDALLLTDDPKYVPSP